jgi:hypothetical protein
MMQQAKTSQDQQMLVLKKALAVESSTALQLIQSAMPSPTLASEGTLGTRINTFA